MTVADALEVRVWVTDVWDTVRLSVSSDWALARLKEEALRRATGRTPDPARYAIKFRGALMSDESRTLAEVHAPTGAPFIVLPARRQPVR